MQAIREQRGIAIMSVLIMVFILAVLSSLILYLSGKEVALATFRRTSAGSLYVSEGGAVAARSALMAFMSSDPVGVSTVDPSAGPATVLGWYAGGIAANQNPFAIYDFIVLDGLRFTLAATSGTNSVTFHLNWGLAQAHRKFQVPAGGPPANTLGGGTYAATVVVTKRLVAHSSCGGAGSCYIHLLNPDEYEFFYTYTITSDGQVPPRARRRVTFSQDFSFRLSRQNFAEYALFRNITTTPTGANVWFGPNDIFDGPVHTNSRFRFSKFPRFTDRVTSVDTMASFYNLGAPVTLAANENVVGGVRRDGPVLPDATPSIADDADNPPANFTRGVASIPIPANAYSQKGVSVGRDPVDTTAVTNLQIRQSIPELADNAMAVPSAIYVPVADNNGNGVSNAGEPLAGGIYVQGSLTSLTLTLGGGSNELAVYTLVAGAQTVTVTVDRAAMTTTVTNTAWGAPVTRTFTGVPKGWQGPGSNNAGMIYVEGGISSLSGTLEEKEQTTIAASGLIDITTHLRYEDPPNPADPNDNPLNVLGVYSASNHIRFTAGTPVNLDIQAVLMAGNTADGFNSSVNSENYSTRPIGTLNLLGGIIEEYSGPVGTLDASGNQLSGFARNYVYDRRMSRGYAPPYFPTTTIFEIVNGTQPLAGVRPIWREASP